jgi:hypothetical protein
MNYKDDQQNQDKSRILEFKRTAMMDTITSVLHGQVISLCSKGAIPAIVQLVNKNNTYNTTALSNGEFKFFHIQSGSYRVTATCPGYVNLKDSSIYLGTGDVSSLKIGLMCEQSASVD